MNNTEQPIKTERKDPSPGDHSPEAGPDHDADVPYAELVENSLTGIYIDQDGKIVYANGQLAKIYHYGKEEIIGLPSRDLVHPEDRDMTDEMRQKRLRGETLPLDDEARGITKDGDTIWVRRRNTQIDYRGRPAILGNIVETTDRRKAEEELLKANEDMSDLAQTVFHDLKTPLIAVHGFTSRLLRDYVDRLDKKGRKYLESIISSAEQMQALISDLNALSRIGRIIPNFENFPSRDVVKEVVAGIESLPDGRQIRVILSGGLPVIQFDRDRFRQITQNLVFNAVKYMGNTKDPLIEIGYEDKGHSHQFCVRDNGIGIDPGKISKVFEKFRRLKEGQEEEEEGTGLGLYIVRRIVRQAGGKVWAESEKGKGSTFYFSLPKVPKEAQ